MPPRKSAGGNKPPPEVAADSPAKPKRTRQKLPAAEAPAAAPIVNEQHQQILSNLHNQRRKLQWQIFN
jgi:hypothetical protein